MIHNQLIKVCGMREAKNIQEVEQMDIDMIGFIFYSKSPRWVCELPDYLPLRARRVGVFVDEEKQAVRVLADRFGLHFVQLHGNESVHYCRSLQAGGLKIIKAFSIAHASDLKAVQAYEGCCHYFLFDTKCKQHGGSGNQFDWSLLNKYNGNTPFLLSGGINEYSAPALKEFQHPALAGFDINSRFEWQPGMKDVKRVKRFLEELKK